MLHVLRAVRPLVRQVAVVAEVLVVAVANTAIAARRLGLLHGSDHAGGKGRAHQRLLPPAGRLVLGQTVEDDGVEDGMVGADPVTDIGPVLPLMFGLVLDAAALDPKPDLPPDPVLVGDVFLSEHRVHLLLVQLDGDLPGLVAPHLVELRGVGAVHPHQALQVGAGCGALHCEVSVDGQVAAVLRSVCHSLSRHAYNNNLSQTQFGDLSSFGNLYFIFI